MDGWRRKKHTLTLTLSLPSTNPPKKQHSRSPPLTDEQTIAAMRAEAAHLDAAFRSRNEAALVRLISDTVGGATLGDIDLVCAEAERQKMATDVNRIPCRDAKNRNLGEIAERQHRFRVRQNQLGRGLGMLQ